MKHKVIGSTDIQVCPIGLGTWEISGDVWGKKNDSESLKAIHVALDEGVNFIDTAAGYGRGHAEELVGKAIKERKGNNEKIVVSTKILPKCGIFAPPPEKQIDDFYPPEWIISQVEKSLSRLQLDVIDILFMHTWSPAWGHRTEWHETMVKLKKEGKIRAIGISIPDEGVTDANVHIEAGRIDVIQCVYNVFQQEPEYSLFPLAKKHNVGIIARSPYSSGALVGTWTKEMKFQEGDWRGLWPKDVKENWLENQVDMMNAVKDLFPNVNNLNLAEIALQYVLTNPNVSSVIPGSGNPNHVKSNISIMKRAEMSEKIYKDIQNLWLERKIHGTYNGSI